MRQEGNRDIVVAMHTMLNVTRANGTIGRRMADARDGYPHRVYITSAHIPELRNIARRTYQDEATFQAAIDEAVQNYLDHQPRGQGYDDDEEDYDEELHLTDFWEYDDDHDQVNYTVDRSNIRYDVQVSHPDGVANRRSVRDLLARPLRGKPYCPEHMWKSTVSTRLLGKSTRTKTAPSFNSARSSRPKTAACKSATSLAPRWARVIESWCPNSQRVSWGASRTKPLRGSTQADQLRRKKRRSRIARPSFELQNRTRSC